jgi:uncharacterized protein YjiS (DUF1127 family)
MSSTILTRHFIQRARPANSNWLGWLSAVLRAMETRHYLIEMDARMLKDIGITRSEAVEEANRAPWDLGPTAPHAPWMWR